MGVNIQYVLPWLTVAAILLGGWLFIKILSALLKKSLTNSSVDPSLHKFIRNGTAVICWIILIGVALPRVGVSLSTFLAVLGVAGAAIALSLKDSLGNIAGGIIIIITKPFRKGDSVEVGDVKGTINQIDLLFTTMNTSDNKMVFIPNGKLSSSTIINCSTRADKPVDVLKTP